MLLSLSGPCKVYLKLFKLTMRELLILDLGRHTTRILPPLLWSFLFVIWMRRHYYSPAEAFLKFAAVVFTKSARIPYCLFFPFILKIFHLDSYKCYWCEESESILIIMEINLFCLSPLLLLSQLWHSAGKLTHSVVRDLWVDLVCLYTASKKLGHARGKHTRIKINKTIAFQYRSMHQTRLA